MSIYRMLIVCLACLLSSCAIVRPKPTPDMVPDGTTSLVIGRSQFIHNGVITRPGSISAMFEPLIMNHVNSFTGIDKLIKDVYLNMGEWEISALVNDDGYFAATLPPGRYYFVAYSYLNVNQPDKLSKNVENINFASTFVGYAHVFLTRKARSGVVFTTSTYASLPQQYFEVKNRMVITFEVLPGKATYIGTMHHAFTDVQMSAGQPLIAAFGLGIINESEKIKDWLAKTYPAWTSAFVTNIAEMRNLKQR